MLPSPQSAPELGPDGKIQCTCNACLSKGPEGDRKAYSTWEKHQRRQHGGSYRPIRPLAAVGRAAVSGVRGLVAHGGAVVQRARGKSRSTSSGSGSGSEGSDAGMDIDAADSHQDVVMAVTNATDAPHVFEGNVDQSPRSTSPNENCEPPPSPMPENGPTLFDESDEPVSDAELDQPHGLDQVLDDTSATRSQSNVQEFRIADEFIKLLEDAKLDSDVEPLTESVLESLRTPPQAAIELTADERLSLDIFLSITTASEAVYDAIRDSLRRHPKCRRAKVLSFHEVKKLVARVSGVTAVWRDMCVNSCTGFTGPYSNLDLCPTCGALRYEVGHVGRRVPRKQFSTVLLGPQLQALWRTPEGAKSLEYRRLCTQRVLNELDANNHSPLSSPTSDFFHGMDYIEAVREGHIKEDDMVLMLSIDGAQLYRNKASDCWIYIWVILDHAPDKRYKKRYVLPAGFIPGPNKPGNIDSYLFPGLYHLSALQREGLAIWDASRNRIFRSHPFLALVTADGPGMAAMNGLVGHHGKYHCRFYCPLVGRHKPGASHYYPARFLPRNYAVEGCSHPDVDIDSLLRSFDSHEAQDRYEQNVAYVRASLNRAQYAARRLQTGVAKPSIFSGLPAKHRLRIPGLFAGDCMHLPALNIPDLMVPLWRGTFDCDKTDKRSLWRFATLTKERFDAHGKRVDAARRWIPGSFDRTPRNPAEKISSGYKAWEFLLWYYGLGPCLFFGDLPRIYWRHYCKFVRAIHILLQEEISRELLFEAHTLLTQWSDEFEELYVERRADRIHFVRASVHAPSHMPFEAIRIGPGIIYSQWTIERTIGNLGEEIKQHANAFANLMQRGLRRCQVNALKAIIPDLEPVEHPLPHGALDLRNGYALLHATDTAARNDATAPEKAAMHKYIAENMLQAGENVSADWIPRIVRWARLSLPNGQIARSRWKEEEREQTSDVRVSRHVKIDDKGTIRFGEVHYFLNLTYLDDEAEKPVAVVSMFGPPNASLLEESYNTYYTCQHFRDIDVRVFDVTDIKSVVMMAPDLTYGMQIQDGTEDNRWFMMEKPGLKLSLMTDTVEQRTEQ